MWQPQLEALPGAGFRVLAPDLRGYGESAATEKTVAMGDLAADLVDLLDQQEIASAAVIGLSMGGLVTMEFAHAHADRTWAVGLVATTADPVTAEEVEERGKA